MFKNATSFNQDLSSWDVSNAGDMSNMFENTEALSESNRCAIHTSFSSNNAWPYDWEGLCVPGCTDEIACNYNLEATQDDGSCNVASINNEGVVCDDSDDDDDDDDACVRAVSHLATPAPQVGNRTWRK